MKTTYKPLLMMKTRGLHGSVMAKHVSQVKKLSKSSGAAIAAGAVVIPPAP